MDEVEITVVGDEETIAGVSEVFAVETKAVLDVETFVRDDEKTDADEVVTADFAKVEISDVRGVETTVICGLVVDTTEGWDSDIEGTDEGVAEAVSEDETVDDLKMETVWLKVEKTELWDNVPPVVGVTVVEAARVCDDS